MKHIIIPIGILIIIGLLFFNLRSCVRNNKLENENRALSKIETKATIIERKVDRFGVEHVIIDAKENTYSKDDVKGSKIEGLLDTTALTIGIQKKQILELTKVISRATANNLKAKYVIDSLKRRVSTYEDKYVKLTYTPNISDSTAGVFDFSYDAELMIVKYNKRKWFLAPNRAFIDISSKDPRMKIQGVDRFVLEQRAKKFAVSLQAVSFYNGGDNTIGAGGGANIRFGRVNLQPTYLYFPRTAVWRPTLQFNYDILKF